MSPRRSVFVATLLLGLGACSATPLPAPVAERAAEVPPPVKLASSVRARTRRPDAACRTAALTSTRKEELFRKFAASQEGDGGPAPDPAPPPAACRQAER